MIRVTCSLILIVLAPCAVLLLMSRGTDFVQSGFTFRTMDTRGGRELFYQRCGRCHSLQSGDSGAGPNLAEIGRVAGERQPGVSGPQYILNSILDPRRFRAPGSTGDMPANLFTDLSDDQLRSLVAFLNLQGSEPGGIKTEEEILNLLIERPDVSQSLVVLEREAVLRGEGLFRGKGRCAFCHPFHNGTEFEFAAPSLFFRGYSDPEALRQAIVEPHKEVAERFRLTTVVLASGHVATGRLIHRTEDSITLQMIENDSQSVMEIPLEKIEVLDDDTPDIQTGLVSAMPSGFKDLFSEEELSDLVAFLLAMNQ